MKLILDQRIFLIAASSELVRLMFTTNINLLKTVICLRNLILRFVIECFEIKVAQIDI